VPVVQALLACPARLGPLFHILADCCNLSCFQLHCIVFEEAAIVVSLLQELPKFSTIPCLGHQPLLLVSLIGLLNLLVRSLPYNRG